MIVYILTVYLVACVREISPNIKLIWRCLWSCMNCFLFPHRDWHKERRRIATKGLSKALLFTRNRNTNFSHLISNFHYKFSFTLNFLNIIEITRKQMAFSKLIHIIIIIIFAIVLLLLYLLYYYYYYYYYIC